MKKTEVYRGLVMRENPILSGSWFLFYKDKSKQPWRGTKRAIKKLIDRIVSDNKQDMFDQESESIS